MDLEEAYGKYEPHYITAFVFDVILWRHMRSLADDEPLGDIEEELEVLIEVDTDDDVTEEIFFEEVEADDDGDVRRSEKWAEIKHIRCAYDLVCIKLGLKEIDDNIWS